MVGRSVASKPDRSSNSARSTKQSSSNYRDRTGSELWGPARDLAFIVRKSLIPRSWASLIDVLADIMHAVEKPCQLDPLSATATSIE
jgi:hypothetical protein